MYAYPTDAEWTHSRVESLPRRFAAYLEAHWQQTAPANYYRANVDLRESTDSLLALRIPLDASDGTICDAARELAGRCAARAQVFHTVEDLRAAMNRICHGQDIEPPSAKFRDRPAIARMSCHLWWRRKLRRHHCQALEAAAIRFGFVGRHRDIYCSNETLRRRQQQNARNAESLESTLARNELGQEYTLAELAATGTANKGIRRAELMTRIAGFERIAREQGHAAQLITITCPSRFHKWRTVGGAKVIPNSNYDPSTNPRVAQEYLAKVWSRIRAALARRGIKLYGFRMAEPQHDGTPHWHMLAFFEASHRAIVHETVTRYALQEAGNERGAAEHRCDFVDIDWEKGSAAAYVAKYIAKNIDGFKLEKDLYGNDAKDTCARVEAWSTTWRIRQFQQIGGPPVGVWRELRRIPALPAGAPEHLRAAHDAVNKVAVLQGRELASVAWDHYCKAQGGVFCGRDARIKLTKAPGEKAGQYGDNPPLRVLGVETTVFVQSSHGHGEVAILWAVESSRHTWEIVRRSIEVLSDAGFVAERAQPAQPWTRVNNCTQPRSGLTPLTVAPHFETIVQSHLAPEPATLLRNEGRPTSCALRQ
jgi:hypothetical protein